jgi:hypothetical protein
MAPAPRYGAIPCGSQIRRSSFSSGKQASLATGQTFGLDLKTLYEAFLHQGPSASVFDKLDRQVVEHGKIVLHPPYSKSSIDGLPPDESSSWTMDVQITLRHFKVRFAEPIADSRDSSIQLQDIPCDEQLLKEICDRIQEQWLTLCLNGSWTLPVETTFETFSISTPTRPWSLLASRLT